ncbi:uncharacterized protein LOC135276756 [Aotus nancymaae]|uniref:uncharacterized protein LOC135276756 n=1 Tax=Aotus nancymaae TaxID=37293 RepID=UPI0030FF0028
MRNDPSPGEVNSNSNHRQICLSGTGDSLNSRLPTQESEPETDRCFTPVWGGIPAMGLGLLHWVALCLLGAGHGDAMVIQNPRYQVIQLGKPVTLSCSQDLNHDAMYWYQQKPSQPPKLLLYYYDKDLNNEADTPDNFQARRPNTSFCFLDIRSSGLGDAATYLCASSRDTELQCCLPSVHKPHRFPDPGAFSRTPPPPPLTTIGSGVYVDSKPDLRIGSPCSYTLVPQTLCISRSQKQNRGDTKMKCVFRNSRIADIVPGSGNKVLKKELKFLISFQNENVFDETGIPKKKFSACPQNSSRSLEIQATEPQDSAVYFCASSQFTVLHIS